MKEIIKQISIYIEEDNFGELDTLLERIFSSGEFSQEQIDQYENFLQETTLYSECRESEYKTEALDIYNNTIK